MSDHRWQGYGHRELYEQIHQGPGADASTDPVRRWSELTTALADIDADIASALVRAMDGWQGDAAETTRSGLRPLGAWASEAQEGAQIMRDRAEQQAEHVGKARTDMPPPVHVNSEDPGMAESFFTHLFGGQTDREVQEAQQAAAEQRAFDVMRTYEFSTEANTTSLASFTPPPQVTVDAPPARPVGGGGLSQPGVTISWAPAVPATPTTAPGVAGSRAGGAASRNGALRAVAGLGSPAAPSTGSGTHARGLGASSGSARRDEEPATVDSSVTEDVGDQGGFFDEPRTPSRPVIGGEAG